MTAKYSFEGQKEHAAMDKTPDTIQELVAAARRKQILDAATQVFAQKGFHRATIKEIARVAGIAAGTIYTYFASKTEVLLGILHRLNESTEREQQLTLEGEQDLRSFFTSYLHQRMGPVVAQCGSISSSPAGNAGEFGITRIVLPTGP